MRASFVLGTINPASSGGGTPTFVQGQSFTVTGSGFGTKSRGLAPVIRDTQTNGIGTVDPQWAHARPALTGEISAGFIANAMQIQPTNFNPQGSNVGAPHQFVGGIYAATAHDGNAPSDGSVNWTYERYLRWQFNLPSTIQSGDTCCIYARWYERNDPAWNLTATLGSENNKHLGYGPYGYAETGAGESSPQSWICNINNDGNSPGNNTQNGWLMVLADNSTPGLNILEYPDRNGHANQFWGHKLNPYKPANGWLLCELEMCIDTTTGSGGHGYVNLVVNGQRSSGNPGSVGQFVSYAGRTDNFMSISPTIRSINFGCGMYGVPINDPSTTNYLADFYCDMTAGAVHGQVARLVLGDQPTYAASAIIAPQVISSWSNTSITATCWMDKFAQGQTVYAHVVSESGAVQDNVASGAISSIVFDFFVSLTGSDSNAGTTPATAWAITSLMTTSANFSKTSGKKIGIMPGTYNISTQMAANSNVTGAFQIDGGTAASPTLYAACDANGNYLGPAGYNSATGMTGSIITVKTPGGAYNAGQNYPKNGPILAHISPAHLGNITIDGLTFTGGAYKGIRVGGASSGDGPNGITGVTIQNCVVTDMSAVGLGNDNFAMIWIDGTIGAVVQNNYIHDNLSSVANSADHLEAVFIFGKSGVGSSPASGNIVQNLTVIRSGGVCYGKIDNIQQTTIQANYCDASAYTAIATIGGVYDCSGNIESPTSFPNPNETGTNVFRNNILILAGMHGIGRNGVSESFGYTTPMTVNNNTVIMGSSGAQAAFWLNGMSTPGTASGGLRAFNNVYSGSPDAQGNGCFITTPVFPAVLDYNMYLASGMKWALRSNANPSTVLSGTPFTSIASFAAALSTNGGISGAETHTVLATPSFSGTGRVAQQKQLVAGSTGSATSANPGSTDGTTGGAACDRGAWGNLPPGITSIGCSFGP